MSNFIKKHLPVALKEEFQKDNLLFCTELSKYPSSEKVSDALISAFFSTNDELHKQPFDVRFSGSTCVTTLVIGK